MFDIKRIRWKEKGQMSIERLIIIPLVVVFTITIFTVMSPLWSVARARTTLEDQGYVVLSAGEYATINSKLDALKVSADLAVVNAEAAVVAAEIAVAKVDLFNSAEVYLFPATSNLTLTLTAGNTNAWSAWAEIVDSESTNLSSKFTAASGFLSDIHVFLPSDPSDGYNIEISYGASKTTLGRTTFYVPADSVIPYILPIKSRRVPAGETVYYRMQSTGGNGATVQARFRYFYE